MTLARVKATCLLSSQVILFSNHLAPNSAIAFTCQNILIISTKEMELKIHRSHWGTEGRAWDDVFPAIKSEGFAGIEASLTGNDLKSGLFTNSSIQTHSTNQIYPHPPKHSQTSSKNTPLPGSAGSTHPGTTTQVPTNTSLYPPILPPTNPNSRLSSPYLSPQFTSMCTVGATPLRPPK